MAEINPHDLPPELEELAKELPEDVDMEDLIQNITRMAMQFVQEQGTKPIPTQLLLLFGFLLIPISLIRKWKFIPLFF